MKNNRHFNLYATIALVTALFFSVLTFVPQSIVSANAEYEYDYLEYESLDVTIDVHEDGTMTVHERFVENGNVERRGIIRDIPTMTFEDSLLGPAIYQPIEIVEILMNDKPAQYEIEGTTERKDIRIGDPNVYLSGKITYDITYKIERAVKDFDDYTEVYWDVSGANHSNSFQKITTTINLPQESETQLSACYTGYYREESSDCKITNISDSSIQFETTRYLGGSEYFTVLYGFDKGIVQGRTFVDTYLITLIANSGVFLPIPISAFWFLIWMLYGNDKKYGKVIKAQFKPSSNLSPALGGAVYSKTARKKEVVAMILDLARRGVIQLNQVDGKKEYEFILLKTVVSDLTEHENKFLTSIFGSALEVGKKINTKSDSLKLGQAMSYTLTKIESELSTKSLMSITRKTALGWGTGLFSFIFLFSFFVMEPLIKFSGYFTIIGAIVSVGISFIFIFFMDKKTDKGLEIEYEMECLKEYISMAEKDRINFHQSPENAGVDIGNKQKRIEIFESLLPYAIIFNLEKEWQDEFGSLIEDYQPTWIHGANGTSIGINNLGSALNSISSSTSSAYSSATSSSSSSRSGFSGGGFSGGGSGGGGSRSW